MEKVIKKYHLSDHQQEIDNKHYWEKQSFEHKIEILESLRRDAIKLGLYPNHHEDKQRLLPKGTPSVEQLFELLNKNEVSYVVVGGYAFAIHAEPGFTKDLNLLIKRGPENAKKIVQTLEEFWFSSIQLSENDFMEPDQVIQIGNPPYRVDFLTSISGATFEEARSHKVKGNYGDQIVYS